MSATEPTSKAAMNAHFFRREDDGSVRIRMRFTSEEAALIEEAAGDTPLLLYIHRVLNERARHHVAKARKKSREVAKPPRKREGG